MSQLAFTFYSDSLNSTFKEDDFLLLKQNSKAFNFLKKFFSQKDFTKASCTSLILKGEEACGKTHLLNIFVRKHHAEFLNKENISLLNLSNYFLKDHIYVLDDAYKIKDETLIFHIINAAFENQAFLILVFNDIPNFKLKDLVSRLKNISSIEIESLDLDSTKQLLQNYLSRRQIKISHHILNFIVTKLKMRCVDIFDAARFIESHIAASGKKLNIKDARAMFK